ncbi:hypothetical protein FGO68_gene6720 [Halteria grandinella]|uniref:Uncharacterized protein n=1 Tax=Halteria grandinella TaxID=5974 RepID=A0A8J8NT23_HALGN|nr:hypothetical protein FGO68_gene6720 [Halteria grandinella]
MIKRICGDGGFGLLILIVISIMRCGRQLLDNFRRIGRLFIRQWNGQEMIWWLAPSLIDCRIDILAKGLFEYILAVYSVLQSFHYRRNNYTFQLGKFIYYAIKFPSSTFCNQKRPIQYIFEKQGTILKDALPNCPWESNSEEIQQLSFTETKK